VIAFKPLQIIENINNGGGVGFDIYFLFVFQYYLLTLSSSINQTLVCGLKSLIYGCRKWLKHLLDMGF